MKNYHRYKSIKKILLILILALSIAGCRNTGEGSNTGAASFASPVSGNSVDSGPHSAGLDTTTHAQPEPNTMILFGVGLAGLIGAALRKRSGKA